MRGVVEVAVEQARSAEGHDLDLIERSRRRTGVERSLHAVAGPEMDVLAAQVGHQRRWVMRSPVQRIQVARAEDGVGIPAAQDAGGELDDGRRGRDRFRVAIDLAAAGERGHRGEEVGMPRRVAERAETALRQPGDGAARVAGDGPEVGIDPGDQLDDVERLPHGLAEGPGVEPVREPAAAVAGETTVGHDHDQRQLRGGCLGVAGAHPVRRASAGAVKEIQHRIGVRRRRHSRWGAGCAHRPPARAPPCSRGC